jgi:hypothetical protein
VNSKSFKLRSVRRHVYIPTFSIINSISKKLQPFKSGVTPETSCKHYRSLPHDFVEMQIKFRQSCVAPKRLRNLGSGFISGVCTGQVKSSNDRIAFLENRGET